MASSNSKLPFTAFDLSGSHEINPPAARTNHTVSGSGQNRSAKMPATAAVSTITSGW